jgi:hypothetical protein
MLRWFLSSGWYAGFSRDAKQRGVWPSGAFFLLDVPQLSIHRREQSVCGSDGLSESGIVFTTLPNTEFNINSGNNTGESFSVTIQGYLAP